MTEVFDVEDFAEALGADVVVPAEDITLFQLALNERLFIRPSRHTCARILAALPVYQRKS